MNDSTPDKHPFSPEWLMETKFVCYSLANSLTNEEGETSTIGLMYATMGNAAEMLLFELLASPARAQALAEAMQRSAADVCAATGQAPADVAKLMMGFGQAAETWARERAAEIIDGAVAKLQEKIDAKYARKRDEAAADAAAELAPPAPPPGAAGPDWVNDVLKEHPDP